MSAGKSCRCCRCQLLRFLKPIHKGIIAAEIAQRALTWGPRKFARNFSRLRNDGNLMQLGCRLWTTLHVKTSGLSTPFPTRYWRTRAVRNAEKQSRPCTDFKRRPEKRHSRSVCLASPNEPEHTPSAVSLWIDLRWRWCFESSQAMKLGSDEGEKEYRVMAEEGQRDQGTYFRKAWHSQSEEGEPRWMKG
ncbi:uncharacterized protein MYCFIDRAFT_177483 [Pseudocercospora fijiensis CIRAD86]|uniref:Uncharacterized protein n=1 Tax=Pseudocercospora fijiensis (strain CIRAD86) TaxID=383855 RepID=M2YS17_PSEFD|nr:uncharacterized protein MYCFIDRAFT_177483 [Pseudocercospora fijiensis CIRAD86]EME80540.1 hypothetical protein MYCFIDRAFT_177483 [Pseudocercospora fijiensis CIRAD86]